VSEIMLHGSRVVAVVGELVAARMPQHVRVHRNGNAPVSPVRASILRKLAGDIGARRSAVNTYRDGIASRWSLRRVRSSPPPSGCTLGMPFLIRRTCNSPCSKST
jgi:hypothetical protein